MVSHVRRTRSSRVSWVVTSCLVTGHLSTNRSVLNPLHLVQNVADTLLSQIVLYVVSRVVASILSRDRSKPSAPTAPGQPARPLHPNATQFSIFAAVAWGAVMWLFENHAEVIQPGMWSSMVYLYRVR